MRHVASLLVALAGAVAGCGGGVDVALNERQFLLPSREKAVAGCTMHELQKPSRLGGGSWGTGNGGGPDGILVSQQSDGLDVLVQVSHDGVPLAHRRYDEAFFRSQQVDQFEVRIPSGAGRLLRYWGTFDAQGNPVCAPFEDLGER
jgi:hypothetical protein